MKALRRVLIRWKFNSGYYTLQPVYLSGFHTNNSDVEKSEEINGFTRQLTNEQCELYRRFPIGGVSNEYGQYAASSLLALFEAGTDTGIRLCWNYNERRTVSDGGPRAVNLKSGKLYISVKFAINERYTDKNYAVETILNKDFWMSPNDYEIYCRDTIQKFLKSHSPRLDSCTGP